MSTTTPASHSVVRATAPLLTLGATWAVRKGMIAGYEAATGRPAPVIANRDANILPRILWAAAMAASMALIEIAVWQLIGDDD